MKTVIFLILVALFGVGRAARQLTSKRTPQPGQGLQTHTAPDPASPIRTVLELLATLAIALIAVYVTSRIDDQRSDRDAEAADRRSEEAEAAADRRQLLDNLNEPDLRGIDLRGQIITDLILIDKSMERAILEDADLSRVSIQSSNLGGAFAAHSTLIDANLDNIQLDGADLRDSDMSRATLVDVDLNSVDLTDATLTDARFNFADASSATATNVSASGLFALGGSWNGANLSQADLTQSRLIGVSLFGVDLSGADLEGAVVVPPFATTTRPPDLDRVALTEAGVAQAFNISERDLDRVLNRAGLSRDDLTDLRPLDFVERFARSALEVGVDYTGIDVAALIEIAGYRIDEFTVGTIFDQTILRGANLSGVDFRNLRIQTSDLTDIIIAGSSLESTQFDTVGLAGLDFSSAASTQGLLIENSKAQLTDWSDDVHTNVTVLSSNMDFADMSNSRFVGGTFRNVSLRGADLRGADLSNVSFENVDMEGACLDDTTLLPFNPSTTDSSGCASWSSSDPPDFGSDRNACATGGCLTLQVVGTIVDGVDLGVYVRECPNEITLCPNRLALAAFADIVWGECRVTDGLRLDGSSTWVRVRWNIVPGSMPSDGVVDAQTTGYSSPNAPGVGWILSVYLGPSGVVDSLPKCSD